LIREDPAEEVHLWVCSPDLSTAFVFSGQLTSALTSGDRDQYARRHRRTVAPGALPAMTETPPVAQR